MMFQWLKNACIHHSFCYLEAGGRNQIGHERHNFYWLYK